MQRHDLIQKIKAQYHAEPDYPWAKYPDYAVFRHSHNHKWFCLLMSVPSAILGIESEQEIVDIINVKAHPEQIGSLRTIQGVLPAYHMNKEHWVSLVLSQVSDELIAQLLDESFALTMK